jgi:hypothetical protein
MIVERSFAGRQPKNIKIIAYSVSAGYADDRWKKAKSAPAVSGNR